MAKVRTKPSPIQGFVYISMCVHLLTSCSRVGLLCLGHAGVATLGEILRLRQIVIPYMNEGNQNKMIYGYSCAQRGGGESKNLFSPM